MFTVIRHRKDSNRDEIVQGLRDAGVFVFIVEQPVDILTYYRGSWLPLEIKSPGTRPRRDQAKQQALCRDFAIPVVYSLGEAIEAITNRRRAL